MQSNYTITFKKLTFPEIRVSVFPGRWSWYGHGHFLPSQQQPYLQSMCGLFCAWSFPTGGLWSALKPGNGISPHTYENHLENCKSTDSQAFAPDLIVLNQNFWGWAKQIQKGPRWFWCAARMRNCWHLQQDFSNVTVDISPGLIKCWLSPAGLGQTRCRFLAPRDASAAGSGCALSSEGLWTGFSSHVLQMGISSAAASALLMLSFFSLPSPPWMLYSS